MPPLRTNCDGPSPPPSWGLGPSEGPGWSGAARTTMEHRRRREAWGRPQRGPTKFLNYTGRSEIRELPKNQDLTSNPPAIFCLPLILRTSSNEQQRLVAQTSLQKNTSRLLPQRRSARIQLPQPCSHSFSSGPKMQQIIYSIRNTTCYNRKLDRIDLDQLLIVYLFVIIPFIY